MVYISSDWHGLSYEIIQKLFDKVNFSNEDFLFVLGDIIDRGEHGVELIKKIMFEPNIKLIRGNHEQMLLDCSFLFDEITDESIEAFDAEKMMALTTWQRNGAEPTINGLSKESVEMRKMILDFLEETPFYDTVSIGDEDFLLVHAGLSLDACGRICRLSECSLMDLIWTRPKLQTKYSYDFTTVFGHTPTYFYGEEYSGKILKTDTWINVDMGTAHGFSPCLLRLDDMKEFYLD